MLVAAIPSTFAGKKMEVPIPEIAMGLVPALAARRGAMTTRACPNGAPNSRTAADWLSGRRRQKIFTLAMSAGFEPACLIIVAPLPAARE